MVSATMSSKSDKSHSTGDSSSPLKLDMMHRWKKKNGSPRAVPKTRNIPQGYLIDPEAIDILTNNIAAPRQAAAAVSPHSSSTSSPFANRNTTPHRGLLPAADFGANDSDFARPLAPSTPSRHRQKNFAGETCSLCHEPLRFLFSQGTSSEKIIELKCGHLCHGDCFALSIGPADAIAENVIFEESAIPHGVVLPRCKCGKRAVPKDASTTSDALFQQSPRGQIASDDQPLSRLLPKSQNSRYAHQSHSRKHSRGSSVSAISSIISSVSSSPSPSPTSTKKFFNRSQGPQSPTGSLNSQIPLALMRSKIVTYLLNQCAAQGGDLKAITVQLVDSLGLLRIADTLSVSLGNYHQKQKCDVYLFSYALLIIHKGSENYTMIPLVENSNGRFSGERPKIHLRTVSSSGFTLSIKEWLNLEFSSTNQSAIEKWSIAFQNPDVFFPNDRLTDTIDVAPAPDSTQHRPTSKLFLSSSPGNAHDSSVLKSALLVINQFPRTAASSTIIRNITWAFSLLKIDVSLVLLSHGRLQTKSPIIARRRLKLSDSDESRKTMWDELDTMKQLDRPHSLSLQDSIDAHARSSDFAATNRATVIVSSAPIDSSVVVNDSRHLFVEVGLLQPCSSNESMAVSSWEDVMEKLCTELGLDFDELQYTDADDDTDIASITTDAKSTTTTDNQSLNSITTESDSDAEIITEALTNYSREHDDEVQSLQGLPPPPGIDLTRTPIAKPRNSFDETMTIKIDTSPLTPRVNMNNNTQVSPESHLSMRWSSLISDIDRALDESSHDSSNRLADV